eukprot:TRINITY_DN43156_c0_g1_i1.p1 TRINITY_DN43156_c0_g1~~TRINITY_DN43156_c0_g1_i1.p1  ORF type:complete len:265 (+),score=7.19 TRINITY_DN43156_c0_g1_i1:65-796(+)
MSGSHAPFPPTQSANRSISPSTRPNVVMIAIDDMRAQTRGYGVKHMLTPHLDRLAQRSGGFRFERAFAQQAWCAPSRASFLTGLRPTSTHVYDLHRSMFRGRIGHAVHTLPEQLRRHGYATKGMGKIFHHPGNCDAPSWSEPYFTPENELKIEEVPEYFNVVLVGAAKEHVRGARAPEPPTTRQPTRNSGERVYHAVQSDPAPQSAALPTGLWIPQAALAVLGPGILLPPLRDREHKATQCIA